MSVRVLHLSTWDTHGAGRAAHRLHDALRRLGYASRMLVVFRLTDDPDVVAFRPDDRRRARIWRWRRRRRIHRDAAAYALTRTAERWMFTDDRTEHGTALVDQLPACDVLTLHATPELVDHEHFFGRLPAAVPVVWRLPDMGPFTGGCHYDGGCGRFRDRCGACPVLGSARHDDLSRQVWERKRRSLARMPVPPHVVAPSRWVAAQARASSLFGSFPLSVIPNGVDPARWCPGDRSAVRTALGIPADARVVLFVADNTENPIKGFAVLADALRALDGEAGRGLFLLTAGSNDPGGRVGDRLPADRRLHLGRLTCDRLLWAAYNAADVFAMPSLQESFGQTVVEAMACGTPTVGFATGGMSDTVRPGVTGWLAAPGDPADLAAQLARALDGPGGRGLMAAGCRRVAVEEYSSDLQARRYAALYDDLLAARRWPPGVDGVLLPSATAAER
jgi:glycosyltransferase involved in cell wall biosynthesis